MRSMDGAKFGGVWRLASAATNMCPRGNSSEVKFGFLADAAERSEIQATSLDGHVLSLA